MSRRATESRTDRTVDVHTPAGTASGTATLPGELFDRTASVSLMHQVVVAQLAAARQGTHATRTRGQVSGGGVKPYRQKGTGRARQGSIRAPQFTGGGTVHGPQPRDYTQRTPKKMKAAALRAALSDRARENRVHVVSTFVEDDAPKTKTALTTLRAITPAAKVLVVLARDDVANWISLRNLPQVHLLESGQLNTYDVLNADDVVFTEAALEEFVSGPHAAPVVAKPDLRTPDIPGAIPSIEGEGVTDLDVEDAGTAAEAPATKAAAKKAATKKAATKKAATTKAPAKKAAATKAPAKKAPAAEPATAETTDTTEEQS
jgi:large subunit ribosomal protein L4